MFVRKWSALPADTIFPSDLKSLGYFINKDDEVRSIENEDNYFKYFIDRNPRICDRQRFAMNQAIQAEIHERLAAHGLVKVFLPGCTTSAPAGPSVPIFASADLATKSRVVVIFGETHQDLGVLAHRVLGGPGGIAKGSLVSVVAALQNQHQHRRGSSAADADTTAPGVVLANTGELVWWPEGRRTLCKFAFDWTPMRSAAHAGNYIDAKLHRVPGHESAAAHVRSIFEEVLPRLASADAGFDIIGLGDGADVVEAYLNSDAVWARVGCRLNCFASVGGQFPAWELKCDGLREFLKDRTRAYVPSAEPLGMVLAGPGGNSETTTFTTIGCPVFSAGEPLHVETLFIASHGAVLDWLQEVADASTGGKPYRNPVFTVVYSDGPADRNDWCDWEGNEEEEQGVIGAATDDAAGADGLFIIPGDQAVKDGPDWENKGEEQAAASTIGEVGSGAVSALRAAMAAMTMGDAEDKA